MFQDGDDLPQGLYFDTVVHNTRALRFLIDQCGLDHILLGSDYPFDMGDSDPVCFVQGALSEDEQSKILEENPEYFLSSEKD